jgi:hypothetical protein
MKRKTGRKLKKAREFADNLKPLTQKEKRHLLEYCGMRRQPNRFIWRGIHHGYLGGFFIVFGLFFLYMNLGNGFDRLNIVYSLFFFSGIYLVADDLYEHVIDEMSPLRCVWLWMLSKKTWW